jgi:predicted NBD/HSP70 family sugar kinase
VAREETSSFSARQTNRLRVIEALYRHPGASRTTIAEVTGLSRPTVSTFLEELEAAGIVEEHEDLAPRQSGRPPVLMALVAQAAFAVGVDMGHDHVTVAVCDLAGNVRSDAHEEIDVDHEPRQSMELAQQLVTRTIEQAGVPREHVLGVGMALAAPIDSLSGRVYAEGILPSWGGVEPIAEMTERLALPVRLENDANLGALGEHTFGAGRGVQELAYVRLSAGIGLGLVLHGRPYGGAGGIAGELGHVRVERHGPICRCGNRGCLEMVASPIAIARLLSSSRGEPISVQRLIELANAGDRGAQRAIADAGDQIGEALATFVTLLNPMLVVLGGDLAAAGDHVLEPIRAAIGRSGLPPAAAQARVTIGRLGDRAEVLGAAALILAEAPHELAQRLD